MKRNWSVHLLKPEGEYCKLPWRQTAKSGNQRVHRKYAINTTFGRIAFGCNNCRSG